MLIKDAGLNEFFVSLLGDRKMFVSELKDIAKKEKLDIDDFGQIYLKFNKKYNPLDKED
jgi:hypothetical protein